MLTTDRITDLFEQCQEQCWNENIPFNEMSLMKWLDLKGYLVERRHPKDVAQPGNTESEMYERLEEELYTIRCNTHTPDTDTVDWLKDELVRARLRLQMFEAAHEMKK